MLWTYEFNMVIICDLLKKQKFSISNRENSKNLVNFCKPIPRTTKYNIICETSLKLSPKNTSMSFKQCPVLNSFEINLLTILLKLVHLYSAY